MVLEPHFATFLIYSRLRAPAVFVDFVGGLALENFLFSAREPDPQCQTWSGQYNSVFNEGL